jgi:hypothetical protein
MWGRINPGTFGIEGCIEALEKEKVALYGYIKKINTSPISETKKMKDIGLAIKRVEEIEKKVNRLLVKNGLC